MVANKSICFISETSGFGGTEVHTISLIKLLLERNYNIRIISCGHNFYDEKFKMIQGERVKFIKTDISVNEETDTSRKKWRSLLSEIDSDTLILPKGWNEMGSIGFLKTCRKSFRKIYFIEHLEADPMPKKTSKQYFRGLAKGVGFWWYKQKYYRKARSFYADRIVAVSNIVAKSIFDESGYPSDKVFVVQNGVFWKNIERNLLSGKNIRERFNIPKESLIFGMLTRLNHVKGVDIAVRAFDSLTKKILEKAVYLMIAGTGPEEKEIKSLVNNLELDEKVVFTGFFENPLDALSSFDVILFPSRKEGLPLALLEGMAAGCIPIVSNVSGMPEAVNSNELGWVVPMENVTELTKAMFNVLQLDEEAIQEKRVNVRNRIKNNFDAEKNYSELLNILGLI